MYGSKEISLLQVFGAQKNPMNHRRDVDFQILQKQSRLFVGTQNILHELEKANEKRSLGMFIVFSSTRASAFSIWTMNITSESMSSGYRRKILLTRNYVDSKPGTQTDRYRTRLAARGTIRIRKPRTR